MGDRLCIVCQRTELEPTEAQTCVRCLGRVRTMLGDVRRWHRLLWLELVGRAGASRFPPGGSHDAESPLVGGDALVMLGPANDDGRHEDARSDPFPVAWLLHQWEADWRDRQGANGAAGVTVEQCAEWIDGHLGWAAQHHPAFDEFAGELRQLHQQLGAVTGKTDPVDRGAKIPCPECGQPLVRRYANPDPCEHGGQHREWGCDQGGRRDDWVCSDRRCGRVVDDRQYWFAVYAYEQQLSEAAS